MIAARMTPAVARRARLGDPTQYAETVTALLLCRPGDRLPYAIHGHEAADLGAIAAVADLEKSGLVRRERVKCEGRTVEIAMRLAPAAPLTWSLAA